MGVDLLAVAAVAVLGLWGTDYYLDRQDQTGVRAGYTVSCGPLMPGCPLAVSVPRRASPLVVPELVPPRQPDFLRSRLGVSARAAGLSDDEAARLTEALARGARRRIIDPTPSPFSPELEARLLEMAAASRERRR